MPKIHIDKSILINASAEKIYGIINDFHKWEPWSPWLITDQETKLDIRKDGKYYDWAGPVTGTGNMTIISEKENERVDYDLLFLKPFKSRAKVSFVLKQEGDAVRVHWLMDNSLPFFMFWMKKMMVTFIGMDYDRGLNMLKEYAEIDKVNSKLTFNGIKDYPGCTYVGIDRTCAISELSGKMEEDYTKLMEHMMQNHQEQMDGNAFSMYKKWDPINDKVVYTACIPVKPGFNDLLSGMYISNVPATKVHSIHHKGPYQYSGNVWSAQYGHSRAKMFKTNKKISPMEVYYNSPKNTPVNDLESEVIFPVK